MRTPEVERGPEEKQPSTASNTAWSLVLGMAVLPVLAVGAGLAIGSATALRWVRRYQENSLRASMKTQGRLIAWTSFLDKMRGSGGTCIEERFSPKGPVRFWWTPDDVYAESPHKIIDWFTMHKGGAGSPFVRWCRERYTGAEGNAALVDTWGVGKKEIYALWSECRSQSCKAQWVEVAPPETLPLTASR